jgi:hypothetical protein
MKKKSLIVALAVLLATSITSCRTAYQKVSEDTKRTESERILLARACKEEFPSTEKVLPGTTIRDTSFVYDEEAIVELNAIIDSLITLDDHNRERLRVKADSITHLLWTRSRTPCVNSYRVDTLFKADSSAIFLFREMYAVVSQDNVKLKGEVLERAMERDSAREDKKGAVQDARDRLLWLIFSNLLWVVVVFRKPIFNAIATIVSPIKLKV